MDGTPSCALGKYSIKEGKKRMEKGMHGGSVDRGDGVEKKRDEG